MNMREITLHLAQKLDGCRAVGHALILVVIALIIFQPLSESRAADQPFDHILTGFPLTGLHARVDCESCHVDGIFKGTPRRCRGCHTRGNRITATLPPEDTTHNLYQQTECDQCHRASGWNVAIFEHVGITSDCLRCHKVGGGGRSAPNDRIHNQAMGTDCSTCHRSTQDFNAAALLDHSNITSGCEAAGCHAREKARARGHAALADCQTCHSYPSWGAVQMDHNFIGGTHCKTCHVKGGNATAAPSDPLHARVSAQDCSDCHLNTTDFAGATIDHALIITGCAASGCHAADRTRARTHAGLSSCESCHRYPNWTPVYAMNHSAIGATLCQNCHTPGGLSTLSTASDPNHPPTNGLSCSACHSTITFTGARIDHTFITSGCAAAGCHADDKTTARNHGSLNKCESCHHFPQWTSVNMNHNATGTTLCKTCHTQNSLASIVAPNDTVHSNLGTKDCSACHLNTNTFTGAGVDHSNITSGCNAAGCHATDQASAPAPHSKMPSCQSCHRYSEGWANANMSHTATAYGTARCDDCHLYTGRGIGGHTAPGDSRHRDAQSAGKDCNASGCHNTRGF